MAGHRRSRPRRGGEQDGPQWERASPGLRAETEEDEAVRQASRVGEKRGDGYRPSVVGVPGGWAPRAEWRATGEADPEGAASRMGRSGRGLRLAFELRQKRTRPYARRAGSARSE